LKPQNQKMKTLRSVAGAASVPSGSSGSSTQPLCIFGSDNSPLGYTRHTAFLNCVGVSAKRRKKKDSILPMHRLQCIVCNASFAVVKKTLFE
jgi:hypothetical protein